MFKYLHSLRKELPLRIRYPFPSWLLCFWPASESVPCSTLHTGVVIRHPQKAPALGKLDPDVTSTNEQMYKLMPEAKFKANTHKVNTAKNSCGSAQRHFHRLGSKQKSDARWRGRPREKVCHSVSSVAIGQGRRGCRLLRIATLPLGLEQSLLSFMPTWLEPSWHVCVVMWLRSCQLISCGQKRPVLLLIRSATCFPVSASPVALAAMTI